MKLSVLDQSPISTGQTDQQAIDNTLDLARATERQGYHRYWVAEHHSSNTFASATPEIMVGKLASITNEMRIGTGGVLLSHYSPYKVAETFRLLESFYPGRIDLGIGRAPGAAGTATMALQMGHQYAQGDDFPQKVADLVGFLRGELPEDHPFASLYASPRGDSMPEIWLLGSGERSAQLAAHFGLGFSSAHFISEGGEGVARAYQEHFQPSALSPKPQTSLGVFVICAETEKEAKHLATTRDLWRLRLGQGIREPFPSPEEAIAYPYTAAEKMAVDANNRRHLVGTPDQVKAQIDALAEAYNTDEIFVVSITHDHAARVRSYALLAEAYGLTPR